MRTPAILALAACLAAIPARAQIDAPEDAPEVGASEQSSIARPSAARRVVRVFDFEEQDTADTPLPQNWWAAQDNPPQRPRPGFRIWNRPRLDFQVAHTGGGSARVPARGGSTCLRLAPGVIPVFPGGDYRIEGFVMTRGMRHARAGLIARFLDQGGEPVPGAESYSELVVSEDDWTPIDAELIGLFPEAVFLQLDLVVLQPQHRPGDPPDMWREDLEAVAYFDDITVTQIARVEVTSPAPMGVFLDPEIPEVGVLVRDLTGERLVGDLRVYDIDGRIVDRASLRIGRGGIESSWRPDIKRYGWYHARLDVYANDEVLGRAQTSFLFLPPRSGGGDGRGATHRARFGLELADLPLSAWGAAPSLMERLGAGAVTLNAMIDRESFDAVDRIETIASATSALRDRWAEVTLGVFPEGAWPPSGELSRYNSWREAMLDRPDVWAERIDPLLDRFGQRVDRWQVDQPASPPQMDAGFVEANAEFVSRLSRLVPGPMLSAPARADAPAARDRLRHLGRVVLMADANLRPEAIVEALRPYRDAAARSRTELALALAPIDVKVFGGRAQADDIARKAMLARAATDIPAGDDARPLRLLLSDPLVIHRGRRTRFEPTPASAAWRTLADHLSTRRVALRLPSDEGVYAYLLSPVSGASEQAGPVLVAWSDRAVRTPDTLQMRLGDGTLRVVDLFGNESRITPGPASAGAEHTLTLGSSPVFVHGIDEELVRFQASFAIDPPTLPTENRVLDRFVVLKNPWPVSVAGRYAIYPPDFEAIGRTDSRWTFAPAAGTFEIPAHGELRLPITAALSPLEQAGEREIVMDVRLTADRQRGIVRLRTTMGVGTEGVDVRVVARRAPNLAGRDIHIEASVTNTSGDARAFDITVVAGAEYPRQQGSIGELEPGASVMRRFVFADARDRIPGRRVFVSIRDVDTGARVNKSVEID
ncbi:MAG: hypothetical protein JJU33_06420 [Phycisphaerales bacterium]|nr:hypothetical protein [Phycisphaerales bacterium]